MTTDQVLKEIEARNWDEDGHGEWMLISDDLPRLTKALRIALAALDKYNQFSVAFVTQGKMANAKEWSTIGYEDSCWAKEALSQIEQTLNGESDDAQQ